MSDETTRDPRTTFTRALDQTARQIGAIQPEELDRPTPCAEYDVRALLQHVIDVVDMLARLGTGDEAPAERRDVRQEEHDDWTAAFGRARADVERGWADDGLLDRPLTLPWATLSGRDVLDAYTHELTVHSWDLARATDRTCWLDIDLADRALRWFVAVEPADTRAGQTQFGPAVGVPDDAEGYVRLAAYTGREPNWAASRGVASTTGSTVS